MAYAEKRGRGPGPWRVKYKLPGGVEISESGFETKTAALDWGRDQEARIREGRWTDPDAGKITVSEWIDRWLAMQDVGSAPGDPRVPDPAVPAPRLGRQPAGVPQQRGHHHWENAIPARTGVSRRTARDARSLLCTILGDAAAAKPPLIPYNPALRPRNRGRRTGRRLERAPQRVWATPLQALLVAERAALLSGRDEDFTMVVTIAYTGLRWGEVIGLERELRPAGRDPRRVAAPRDPGPFHRLPPKDDSYRSPNWEPCLPVDLPPFLAELLARQIQAQPRHLRLRRQHGGSGHYVFLGPDGGHYRRSNYARRVFRPACDGRYHPGTASPGRLVIADATSWPGSPSPPGHQPSQAPPLHTRRGAGASSPSPRTPRSPAGFRSSPASRRTASGTATRHGWPKTASPRSSPSSAWATRCPACAASTPTPPTGCATTSSALSRPAGRTPCTPAQPSTPTRPSRSSTNSWPSSVSEPAKNQRQQHHARPSSSRRHRRTGRR